MSRGQNSSQRGNLNLPIFYHPNCILKIMEMLVGFSHGAESTSKIFFFVWCRVFEALLLRFENKPNNYLEQVEIDKFYWFEQCEFGLYTIFLGRVLIHGRNTCQT